MATTPTIGPMPRVFISHASLDVDFVDPFVDTVIRLGCGLNPSELFYSSGQDTGVPSGKDLMAHVREQVEATDLVVAVITPTYLTRPVCIAEMGAAWGITDKVFPSSSRECRGPPLPEFLQPC